MKLSYFDCQFLAQKLKNIARNPDVDSYDKRYCDTLLPYFERIVESRPDGVRMSSDVEIAFDDKINERIAELVSQENKVQEKIDLMEKIRANMTKVGSSPLTRGTRLDGYWSELKRLADRWEKDLSDLKEINEISEAEAKAEGEVLELFWDFIEEVDELAEEVGLYDEEE